MDEKLSLKVVSMKKENHIETNSMFLDVSWQIENSSGEVLKAGKFGFPFEISKEDIQANLKKCLETYISDTKLAEQNAALDKLNEEADKAIKELEGKSIS